MKLHILSVDEPEWNKLLQDIPHDFYHLSEYHRFESLNGEGTAQMIVAVRGEEKVAWPYLLRQAQVPGCNEVARALEIHAAYGYPGALCSAGAAGDFLLEALQEFVEHWKRIGVISAFGRFHPTLESARPWIDLQTAGDLDRFQTNGNPPVRVLGPTVSIDLRQPTEERRAGYDKSARRRIRKNEREGMVTYDDADFTNLELFGHFYRATMNRVGADEFYYFDQAYFERLIRLTPGLVHLFVTKQSVAGHGEVIACAGLISEYAGQLQALFIMSNPELLQSSPAKNHIDAICDWGHARGAINFHLGGGKGARIDELFRFKALFSALRHDYCQMNLIIDPAGYQRLIEIRRAREATSLDSTFFPLWRSPLAKANTVTENEPVQA